MADKPILLVGFVATALTAFGPILPDHSVVFIEEPDVIRKRRTADRIAGSGLVRELVAWEYHLPGRADEFYHAHPGLDPAAVVPMTEYATPFAARLAERYRLPGAGLGAAQILRDKELLRRVSAAAGIANPAHARVHGPADVLEFLRACDGPVVLKPANRQASVGTQVIREPAEVAAAWAACVRQDEGVHVPDRAMELRMLAERYVDGAEYSVEMLVRGGRQLFANVTAKQLFAGPRPVELAHVVPADIAPELAGLLAERTRAVLGAVGFCDGIVHCEWIVAGGTPFLVECAGRFAGDGIIELIQRAYPVRLNQAYFAVMRGDPLPEPLPDRAGAAAAVRFLAAEPGVVAEVSGVDEALRADGVFHCAVDISRGARFAGLASSWDRLGEVMVTGACPAQARERAEAAAGLVRVRTTPELAVAAP